MKLYLVCLTSYFETNGIETNVEIFKTREEAVKFLENNYTKNKSYYSEEEFEWNDFEKDSYSFCANDENGYFERYEAQILEKEVN